MKNQKNSEEIKGGFKEYAILELMGHRKIAGLVSEATIGGASFIRIDVPKGEDTEVTQFYSPGAIYCITPTTKEIAISVGTTYSEPPVTQWELPEAL